ncbi:hypothetical protein TNCV_3626141 [Trichonephila clavipes]|nr:hypothetical protein TNCV_3626141 [Trichonephila clavipes]
MNIVIEYWVASIESLRSTALRTLEVACIMGKPAPTPELKLQKYLVGVTNFRIKTGHDYFIKHKYGLGVAGSRTYPLCSAKDMYGSHLVLSTELNDVATAITVKNHCVSELHRTARHRLMEAMPKHVGAR